MRKKDLKQRQRAKSPKTKKFNSFRTERIKNLKECEGLWILSENYLTVKK